MRILRTYRRVAKVQHWCDRCCRYIEPGEYYEGSVHLYKRSSHRLMVFKFHIDPSCDYPHDPDEKFEKTNVEEIQLELAA